MVNYVNEEKFISWYKKVTGEEKVSFAVLDDVFQCYAASGESVYTVPARKTLSGEDEKYEYRFEDKGCCGASTMFIYF